MLGKYLRRVQFEKYTIHHSTIELLHMKQILHHKPSFGLSNMGIPSEIPSDIHRGHDLECIIGELNAAANDSDVNYLEPVYLY